MSARLTVEVGHHQGYAQIADEVRPCVVLWSEVLRLAVEDARGQGRTASTAPAVRRELIVRARAWLTNDEVGVGSFLWICSLLDLEPSCVRDALEAPPP